MRFYPLARLIDLHEGYSRHIKIDSVELLLLQRRGQRYLIEARCPHRDHPLDLATIADGSIECALHHYRFAIDDGRLLYASEEPCRGLRTFDLVYEGAEVGVMLEEGGLQDISALRSAQ